MKMSRLVVSLIVPIAFSFALAGEAYADGACVYVKNETFQCVDKVSNTSSCKAKAPGGLGEFHAVTTCKNIGHGVTWGLASPPAPPAKPNFDGVSYSMKAPAEVPAIPSPFSKAQGKARF